MALLGGRGVQDDRFRSIRDRSRALISNVDDIKVQREALIVLAAGRENLRQELADVRTELDDTPGAGN